jgi:hypothetical protein
MVRSECIVSFNSCCERRKRTVEAAGMRQLTGMTETIVTDSP